MNIAPGTKCYCGKPAAKHVITQGGTGVNVSLICETCYMHAVEHAAKIVKILKCSWYAMPPTLRPDDFKGE